MQMASQRRCERWVTWRVGATHCRPLTAPAYTLARPSRCYMWWLA